MSFAKRAADQLFDEDAENARQEKRHRWMRLLGTVGTLGAAGLGAGYLAKNHGEHWNQGMDWLRDKAGIGVKAPASADVPTMTQQALNKGFAPFGAQPGQATAGRVGGVIAGTGAALLPKNIPGFRTGTTINGLTDTDPESDIAKNMAKMSPEGSHGGIQSMLQQSTTGYGTKNPYANTRAAQNPKPPQPTGDPVADSIRGISRESSDAAAPKTPQVPAIAQVAAMGNFGRIAPKVDTTGYSKLNPAKYMQMILNKTPYLRTGNSNVAPLSPSSPGDVNRINRGLGRLQAAPQGQVVTLPDGTKLDTDTLRTSVREGTGFDPGTVGQKLRSMRGSGKVNPWLRGVLGAAGGWGGYNVGKNFDANMAQKFPAPGAGLPASAFAGIPADQLAPGMTPVPATP